MDKSTTQQLFAFIEKSPTAFHAVNTMAEELKTAGYRQLLESEEWNLERGGRYFVERGGSAILAFRMPESDWHGFQIMASHCDSPMFNIKENPEMEAEGVETEPGNLIDVVVDGFAAVFAEIT